MADHPYQVIARRWRPKYFKELVGQEHIVQTLTNAIKLNRIAHAYLFVGPRGTGKTSTARLFAQALNCENGPSIEYDPSSPLCRAIAQGNCMDVIEIDGASNNSVDQIRALREDCQFAPTAARFKVYIIDEVHMLSSAAFNALLKTLEEPPAHVKFIFATTESQKVLPTIVSRCQRFEFRPISDEVIVEKLSFIAQAEGIKIAPKALQDIARLSQGGMRDAQSILDQMIAFCGETITEEDILDVYGLASSKEIESVATAIAHNEYASLIKLSRELTSKGCDLYRVIKDLHQFFQTRFTHALEKKIPLKLGDTVLAPEVAIRIMDALNENAESIKTSLSDKIQFEMTLLKASEQSQTRAIDNIIKLLKNTEARPSTPSAATPTPMQTTSTSNTEAPISTDADELYQKIDIQTRQVLEKNMHAKVKGIIS